MGAYFRMQADFYHDPKVQSMREAMQRRLLMLFCLKGSGELDTLSDDEVRFTLRISRKQWEVTKALFVAKGFIDEALNLLPWNQRLAQADEPCVDVEDDPLIERDQQRRAYEDALVQRQAAAQEAAAMVPAPADEHEHKPDLLNALLAPVEAIPPHIEQEMARIREAMARPQDDEASKERLRAAEAEMRRRLQQKKQAPTDAEPPQVKPARKSKTHDAEKPDEVEQGVWDDFLKLRKTKKAPLTVTALNQIKKEADKAKMPLNKALEICCLRGWQGFNAHWLEDDSASSAAPASNCPVNKIVELFNELLPELPPVEVITDKRKRLLATIWDGNEQARSREFWEYLFNSIRESDFLMGRGENALDWRLTFDWLIDPDNFVKVYERCFLS